MPFSTCFFLWLIYIVDKSSGETNIPSPSHIFSKSSHNDKVLTKDNALASKADGTVYRCGKVSFKGKRHYMEDFFYLSATNQLAAVFDGHGGASVSKYVHKNLYSRFLRSLPARERWTDHEICTSLHNALQRVDEDVIHIRHWDHQGSTVALAYVNRHPYSRDRRARSNKRGTIIVANIGDSRVVLCRRGKAKDLTIDHKPNLASERARIELLGGTVSRTSISSLLQQEKERAERDEVEEREERERGYAEHTSDGCTDLNIIDRNANRIAYNNISSNHTAAFAVNENNSKSDSSKRYLSNNSRNQDRLESTKCTSGTDQNDMTDKKILGKRSNSEDNEAIRSTSTSVDVNMDMDMKISDLEVGVYRINGNLAVSRAIGDRAQRPFVSSSPFIKEYPWKDEDRFIITATDGLWDVFSSQESVSFVSQQLNVLLVKKEQRRCAQTHAQQRLKHKHGHGQRQRQGRETRLDKYEGRGGSRGKNGGNNDNCRSDRNNRLGSGSRAPSVSANRLNQEQRLPSNIASCSFSSLLDGEDLDRIARRLARVAMRRGSTDNISIVIQLLDDR